MDFSSGLEWYAHSEDSDQTRRMPIKRGLHFSFADEKPAVLVFEKVDSFRFLFSIKFRTFSQFIENLGEMGQILGKF